MSPGSVLTEGEKEGFGYRQDGDMRDGGFLKNRRKVTGGTLGELLSVRLRGGVGPRTTGGINEPMRKKDRKIPSVPLDE